MSENISIIVSDDGSHSLYRKDMDETYHSRRGAIAESRYVFIESGLNYLLKENMQVLEVGFGTGLNALLSYIFSEEKNAVIHYHTLEPYPLPENIYAQLNYIHLLQRADLKNQFLQMHSCPENIEETLSPKFSFTKYYKKLEAFSCPSHSMDVIFYDAFAPSKQPEVWSLSNLQKCAELLKPGGILVTYCASGQFKRDLKTADFEVQVLPGPLGKKEMTRGIKYARN